MRLRILPLFILLATPLFAAEDAPWNTLALDFGPPIQWALRSNPLGFRPDLYGMGLSYERSIAGPLAAELRGWYLTGTRSTANSTYTLSLSALQASARWYFDGKIYIAVGGGFYHREDIRSATNTVENAPLMQGKAGWKLKPVPGVPFIVEPYLGFLFKIGNSAAGTDHEAIADWGFLAGWQF